MKRVTPEQIDAILPQTQCGLCGYGGCLPYAKAIVHEQAPINLCPPGGVDTLQELGVLLQQNPAPYLADMEQKAKPAMVAVIREAECIGCTKCIQACPVDAIIGSAKQMHSIVSDQCTGCELCIAPCPVDCIEMQSIPTLSTEAKYQKAQQARKHFYAHQQRLTAEKNQPHSLNKKPSAIEAALARAREKIAKSSKL